MANEPTIELQGNAVNDPETRTFNNGGSVTQFRIAVTPRYQDKQTKEWKDKETMFFTVKPLSKTATEQTQNVRKGERVLVNGQLTKRSYTNQQGEQKESYEIAARTIAVLPRMAKQTRPQNQAPQQQYQQPPAYQGDPFAQGPMDEFGGSNGLAF